MRNPLELNPTRGIKLSGMYNPAQVSPMKQASAPPRWWDFPAALILLVALYLAAVRLAATNWTDELGIVQTVVVFGTISGLALGQSIFSRRQVAGFAAAYALFIIFWQFGLIFGEGVEWSERLLSLLGRLGVSAGNLLRQRAVTDPILFLFLMAGLFAILSAHAGYTLSRHANAWRTTLPTGLALFIIHIHDPFWTSRSWFLAGYIFLALLLLARLHFLHKRAAWRENHTHLPPYVGLDFLRATILAAGLLIVLAWTAPALAAGLPPAQQAWETISRPLYEARARMSNAFAALQATVGVVQDYYGDVLPLGRGNTLTDVVVFTVDAPQPPAGVRYYWRARAYDSWTGSDWEALPTDVVNLEPDAPDLVMPNLSGRWEAEFTFTAAIPLATIFAVPQPLAVSRPVKADLLSPAGSPADILRMSVTPSVRPGEIYRVRSSLTSATVAELQAAGTAYPDWVAARYLQLPDSITTRTRDLAAEIAAPYTNAYDIAEAVTQWMRENITYNATFPVPPQNRDILDYMLFDLQEGFCNYYATAEIILLRSLGIPARLAVGYAQGELSAETGLYTVRQKDAHAWPEVYFPGIGWVEFEPTVNQRPLRRLTGNPGGSGAGNPSGSDDPTGNPDGLNAPEEQNLEALLGFEEGQPSPNLTAVAAEGTRTPWVWLALLGIGILVGAFFTWYRARLNDLVNPMVPISVQVEKRIQRAGIRPPGFLRTMAYRAALPLEARAYEQINRSLRTLGAAPDPHFTPSERAGKLQALLPAAAEPIQALLRQYLALAFGSSEHNGHASPETAQQAARTLRNQTFGALFQRVFSRFQDTRRRDTLV